MLLPRRRPAIYGRFGYGVATRIAKVEVDTTGGLPLAPAGPRAGVPGRPGGALPHGGRLYERVGRRAGAELSAARGLVDHAPARSGEVARDGSRPFCVVHEDDTGTVDGYCWYRARRADRRRRRGRGEVKIWDLAAESPEVEAALLQYLASIDLTRSITTWTRPSTTRGPTGSPTAAGTASSSCTTTCTCGCSTCRRPCRSAPTSARDELSSPSTTRSGPDGEAGPPTRSADEGKATCERVNDDGADLSGLQARRHRSRVAVPRRRRARELAAGGGRLAPSDEASLGRLDRIFPTARKPYCIYEF